uniref:C-type lectin domain-containing protein n=1 Tax=Sciurus vulgaris TaxID=55149 RepID=A0A8D2DA63_SCIVU
MILVSPPTPLGWTSETSELHILSCVVVGSLLSLSEPVSSSVLWNLSSPVCNLGTGRGIQLVLIRSRYLFSLAVSRVPEYPQGKFQDHQGNSSLGEGLDDRVLSGKGLQGSPRGQAMCPTHSSPAGLCRPCPWSWEAFQGSCYFFSRTLGSWEDSISSCRAMGAHLVIINNAAEQRFLRYWDIRKNQRTWIGLSDHNNEGSWYWVDNTPLRLSFWKEGEPNDAGNEDCVELAAEDWNDSRCAAQNFWVCERPSAPCPGA